MDRMNHPLHLSSDEKRGYRNLMNATLDERIGSAWQRLVPPVPSTFDSKLSADWVYNPTEKRECVYRELSDDHA